MADIDENAVLGDLDLDFLANKARHEIAHDPQNIGTARMWWSSVLAVVNEVKRTRKLINTPHTSNFIESVRLEAAHQIQRWGVKHDAGKRPEDWITLLVYLTGKAATAHFARDREKLKHHVITTAAACLNWWRALIGDDNRMRPGVG